MLSVYYHALGSRLELRSAPAVMAPIDVEPLPLDEALQTLRSTPRSFNQAMWTISRGVKPHGGGMKDPLARYPGELLDVLGSDSTQLRDFELKRRAFREDAHTFGEALDRFAENNGQNPEALRDAAVQLKGSSFSVGVQAVGALGVSGDGEAHTLDSYLTSLAGKEQVARRSAATGLRRLAEEVGLPLPTFLEEYAHAVAFEQTFPGKKHDLMTVLPASSVTVQDARSLTTVVTVTALVRTDNLSCVSIGLDPQCWMICSDAFKSSRYLDSADRRKPDPRPKKDLGTSYKGDAGKLIEEKVRIVWGTSAQELGSFHNLLNVTKFHVRKEFPATVSMEFNLHRCLSSRVLWDVRPGGILLDEGYARARQVANGLFRLTVRKTLRFSDRTPYRGGAGWHDLGQLLNLLAPAAMSWWLESEMYNGACPTLLALARKHEVPAPTSQA